MTTYFRDERWRIHYLAVARRDAFCRWVAWRLPRRIAYWAAIRVAAHATTGRWGTEVPYETTVVDALKRWPQR